MEAILVSSPLTCLHFLCQGLPSAFFSSATILLQDHKLKYAGAGSDSSSIWRQDRQLPQPVDEVLVTDLSCRGKQGETSPCITRGWMDCLTWEDISKNRGISCRVGLSPGKHGGVADL